MSHRLSLHHQQLESVEALWVKQNPTRIGTKRMPANSRATEIAENVLRRVREFFGRILRYIAEIAGQHMHLIARQLYTRYDQSGDVQYLDAAIVCHILVLRGLCTPGHPNHSMFLDYLAFTIGTRYDHFGDPEDLEDMISLFRENLGLRPPGHPHRPISLISAAHALERRYNEMGNADDLEDIISLHREALGLCPPGHPNHCSSLNDLADALSARYHRLHNAEDLQDRIFLYREVLSLQPPGHPDRFKSLDKLASALSDNLGNASDLEDSISLRRQALNLSPPGHPDHSSSLISLASALRIRYDEVGDADDLQDSISLNHEALSLLPPDHPHRSGILNNLANAHYSRFHNSELANAVDLEDAISLYHEALDLRPLGRLDRSSSLNNLAAALNTRYEELGNINDLEESISLHREALSLRPLGHPHHLISLTNLSGVLRARYDKTDNPDDFEDSISLDRKAISLLPPGHPQRFASLINLADVLIIRYQKLGNTDDLENSISFSREAISLFSPGNPRRFSALCDLASCLIIRYRNSGHVDDLEHSISLYREALSRSPPGHRGKRSNALNSLASALRDQYDSRLGNTNNLEDSVLLDREALSLCPLGHPDRSMALRSLANSLITRYHKFGTPDDLEASISLNRGALSLHPSGHPNRPGSLNDLGCGLRSRYRKFRNVNDLEESMSVHREALGLLPSGHPDRPRSLNNLANALRSLYRKSRNINDLEDSISLDREALTLRPAGHPHRAQSLFRLGESMMLRHSRLHNIENFLQAFDLFAQAASDPTSYLQFRLSAAIEWVKIAHDSSYTYVIIFSAYKTLLQLVHQSLIFRPSIESQQKFLASSNIPTLLASDAASAAISAGKIMLAVEFMEQGRALLWSRVNAYKHPLHQLRQVTGGEELADRLQAVSAKLERLSLVSESNSATLNQDFSTRSAILDNQMKEHHVLSEEWEDLVGKIREVDGFGSFLLAASFHTLQSAAAEGPVILVNISKHRSDAIILLEEGPPALVNLPEILLPELRSQKCGSAREITSTLAYLWDTIVSPIVDRLAALGVQRHSRIWWCPTAELCALPLHVAGRGKNNLQDLYISSYTSTLSSLIRATSNDIKPRPRKVLFLRGPPNLQDDRYSNILYFKSLTALESFLIAEAKRIRTPPKLLVVGQPSTDLTRVQDEVDIIEKLRPGVDVLFGPSEATREAVLEGLKDHSWVHFACHGLLGDAGQPFQASFKLHENPKLRLQLLDLIQARLPNAEFAFLSACHSAAGGLSTPDENIHLSTALQFCGFKSVVGTLWEMDDEDGPTISEQFYKYMFRNPDRIDYMDSARALSSAINEMRKAKVPMHRLAMFVHIGA